MEEKDIDKIEKKEEKITYAKAAHHHYFWSYPILPLNIKPVNIKPEYAEDNQGKNLKIIDEATEIILKKIKEANEIYDEVNNGQRHIS